MGRYQPTEDTLYSPVTVEELDELREHSLRDLRSKDSLRHLLFRTRVTVSNHEQAIKDLRKQLEKATAARTRLGAPSTLSPLDALQYASPEELSGYVGRLNAQQIQTLQNTISEAEETRDTLLRDLTVVRNITNTLLERADMPPQIRTEFINALNRLPENPGAVTTPKILQMARLVGQAETPAKNTFAGQAEAASTGQRHDLRISSRELPAGDVEQALQEAAHPDTSAAPVPGAAANTPRIEHTLRHELPAYGPAPTWVPGPGPQVGAA